MHSKITLINLKNEIKLEFDFNYTEFHFPDK